MKNVLAAIALLAVATPTFAGLQLQTARCSSKDFTLDIALVTNGQPPEMTKPNAKGVLSFRAKTAEGKATLGKWSASTAVDLATETWPQGFYIMSYAKGKIDLMMNSSSDVENWLQNSKPLLYFYSPDTQGLEGTVSIVRNKRINWDDCSIDYDSMIDLTTQMDVKKYPVRELKEALRCPKPYSNKEINLILNEGPQFEKSGSNNICFHKILNREVAQRGKSLRTMNKREINELVSSLMSASWKAETTRVEEGR